MPIDIIRDFQSVVKSFGRSFSVEEIPENFFDTLPIHPPSGVTYKPLAISLSLAKWRMEFNNLHPEEAEFEDRIDDMQAALYEERGGQAFDWVEKEEPGAYERKDEFDRQRRLYVVGRMREFLGDLSRSLPKEIEDFTARWGKEGPPAVERG